MVRMRGVLHRRRTVAEAGVARARCPHRMLLAALLMATPGTPEASPTQPVAPRPTARHAVLPNGFQVVWDEDHRQSLIALEVRIKGGLRGEGRRLGTGVTHFIEHMLFKGTATRPPGSIEQEVRRYGGTINAFTSLDTTGISLFVDSRYLGEALALLADVLQHAVFDPAECEKERAVIISEIQMNLDDPERRLHRLFWGRHFLEHPYRHPILGYQPLLVQLTASDLTEFYRAQYQPQHVTLACVGDLDGEAFLDQAKAVFEPWGRGTGDPQQYVVPSEPPAASDKTIADEMPLQTVYGLMGFSSTRLADPDLYPLDVLASILGQGKSSRLYELVVRQRQLAHAISAWNYTPQDPGVFGIQFRTDAERLAGATEAILRVLADIQSHGVTDAELQTAKRKVTADYVFRLQTVESKAADLADSFAATGDPLFSRRYVEGVGQVSRQAVQAAARRYCDPSTMTLATVRPPAEASGAAPSQSPTRRPRPAIARAALPNGATTLVGLERTLPIAAIVVTFRGGVRVETEQSQGLSNLVAQLLTKGTRRRSALEIAREIESLGGSLEPFSGRDSFGIALQLLAQDLDQGLQLAHELVTEPTFPQEELDLSRALITKQLQAQDDEIFDVGGRLLRQTLFAAHPYRFNPLGDQAALGTFTRDDVLRFAKRWLSPSNMVISVFGDLDSDEVSRQLRRSFGRLPPAPSAWPERLPDETLAAVHTASQAMEREQTLILLGFRGSTHAAQDRDTVDVLTAILSGMAGRLFQSVREQQGLSYSLGAVHAPGWDPGYLLIYAATRPREQQRVLKALDDQLDVTIAKGVTEEEVQQATRYLVGLHRLDLQHLLGLAKRTALDELYGVGFDAWATYEDRVRAVTVSMVNEAAKRYLTPGRRAEVVVGPLNGQPARHEDARDPLEPPPQP